MSRNPGSSLRKPPALEFPRPVHPLSPPDTDPDSHEARPSTLGREAKQSVHIAEKEPSVASQHMLEGPSARFRRVAYQTAPSVRESSRERSTSRSKWLVTVIPPASVVREHGHFGHTLGSGPSTRLASGILMPLFPTMYGQLTAIQREFGFPSTSGLCLYLHVTENGMAMAPRVSDETWQLLWGHLFDERAVPPIGRLPIGGQIEFDIDVQRARWYNSWLSGGIRDETMSVASFAPSHWRGDSRTTFAGAEVAIDDPAEETGSQAKTPMPMARHAPKQLSLLNRFDGSPSFRSISRRSSRAAISPPEHTIAQVATVPDDLVEEDEPQTAKVALDKVVESWRAAANVGPTLSTLTGQTSLDPVNMPNTLALDVLPSAPAGDEDEVSVLNLDDYAWSISSAGPPSEWPESPLSWNEGISVHIDRRAQGSVCLTPSTCTSFGPPDSWPASPVGFASPLPSPDIAYRMLYDVPLTPMTATSWGAPSEWPESPAYDSRAPSIDLGHRGDYSRPVTPGTATSWGAPSEWPESPILDSPIHTPHLGDRMFEGAHPSSSTSIWNQVWPTRASGAQNESHAHSFPYYNAWKAEPWQHVFPYQLRPEEEETSTAPWQRVWPYQQTLRDADFEPKTQAPYSFTWPYYVPAAPREPELGYPYIEVYTPAYPHIVPYPTIPPVLDHAIRDLPVQLGSSYPIMSLYPAIYPSFEIYPGHVCAAEELDVPESVKAARGYPMFMLYPPVKPIKRTRPVSFSDPLAPAFIVCELPAHYPSFASLYKASYPHNLHEIYPTQSQEYLYKNAPSVTLEALYPQFNLYPAAWPNVMPYPPVAEIDRLLPQKQVAAGEYPNMEIYPNGLGLLALKDEAYYPSLPVTLKSSYPALTIYAPAYPHVIPYPDVPQIHSVEFTAKISGGDEYPKSLNKIYPSVIGILAEKDELYYPSRPVELPSSYPQLITYRAQYPFVVPYPPMVPAAFEPDTFTPVDGYPANLGDIYPSDATLMYEQDQVYYKSLPVELPSRYPALCVYRALYPYLEIYPAVSALQSGSSVSNASKLTRAQVSAATIGSATSLVMLPEISRKSVSNVGPRLLYPSFEIYSGEVCDGTLQNMAPGLVARYPIISLYPTLYPAFEIYPGEVCDGDVLNLADQSTKLVAQYPNINLYPVSYPLLEVYPGEICDGGAQSMTERSSQLIAYYPNINLYPVLYPAFEIYPRELCDGAVTNKAHQSPRLLAHYPIFNLYPVSYPLLEIYPGEVCDGGARILAERFAELDARYPIISLYPARYPSFEVYPGEVCDGSCANAPVSSAARKSHLVLHLEIFGTLPRPPSVAPRRRPLRTHSDLHQAVVTESRLLIEPRSSVPAKRKSDVPHVQVPFVENIPPSAGAPAPDSRRRSRSGTVSRPTVLPVPSNSRTAPRSPVASAAPSRRLSGLPSSPADGRRTTSTSSRPNLPLAAPSLPPVAEQEKTDLSRSKSMSAASKSIVPPLSRTGSLSRGRDSMIAERMKAFTRPSEENRLPMDTLTEFPMPPRPPLPSLPARPAVSKLDRSKIPFA